jgi:hypothetical protein
MCGLVTYKNTAESDIITSYHQGNIIICNVYIQSNSSFFLYVKYSHFSLCWLDENPITKREKTFYGSYLRMDKKIVYVIETFSSSFLIKSLWMRRELTFSFINHNINWLFIFVVYFVCAMKRKEKLKRFNASLHYIF